jgi:hypothetical protein
VRSGEKKRVPLFFFLIIVTLGIYYTSEVLVNRKERVLIMNDALSKEIIIGLVAPADMPELQAELIIELCRTIRYLRDTGHADDPNYRYHVVLYGAIRTKIASALLNMVSDEVLNEATWLIVLAIKSEAAQASDTNMVRLHMAVTMCLNSADRFIGNLRNALTKLNFGFITKEIGSSTETEIQTALAMVDSLTIKLVGLECVNVPIDPWNFRYGQLILDVVRANS